MSTSIKKGRESTQWKNLRKVYQFKDENKKEAIKSVQQISRHALNAALIEDSTRSVIFAHDMLDPTADLNSNRDIFEENKNLLTSIVSRDSINDYFTATSEDRLSTLSGIKRRKKKKREKATKLFGRKKFEQYGVGNTNYSQVSNEAWMCGVCAKSFSSFEAANRHEDYHIKEIVTDLGWAHNSILERESSLTNINMNDLSVFESASEGIIPIDQQESDEEMSHNARSVIASSRQPLTTAHLSYPIRPDVLAVSNSTRLLSTRNLYHQSQILTPEIKPVHSRTEDSLFQPIDESQEFPSNHDLLGSHSSVDDYVVLADEALTDVCLKAEKIALSQLEQEAEFELECYSKDKHYYDMLEQREIERQKEGSYSRFRTEGKNFAEKIQNRFVDAYAVMKQGKSKKTMASVDHYKRKIDGDLDVRNEIGNTKQTLYVNVIVKNSIQVVSHELDRLARQRWEEHKKNEESMDIRNEESRTQFEKFKAAAQGQLVQLAGLALASDFTPRRIAVQLSNDLYRLLTPYVPFCFILTYHVIPQCW